ncbi:receptor-like protein EIX2 [Macadamia integrifolia]|uniref:receptor-like protein EIX2 n=1 Tax=Macadamia integrifolia TaxID=60698 RepID=UPI001C4ED1E8|nr:receptor-like protein EIX2 [Macadamia integrifolia]
MGRFFVTCLVLLILCLLSSIEKFACNGETHCLESDWEALLQFKSGLNDPENRLLSWQGNDCCQWKGVQCDNSSGAVTAIDLHNPHPYDIYHPSNRYGFWNLSGNIDPALLRLKSLRHLDISLNTFDGIPIPDFIGSLQALQYLNLSNAGFSGAVPPSLGNLSSLQSLDVSSGFLSLMADSLQWVAGLSSLRHLAMNGVDLSMVGSNWVPILNRLPLLNELHLSLCGLTGPIPSLHFVNFTLLAVLDLSFNSFSSMFPDWIVNISSLVYLDMSSSSLKGRIPLGISELPNLQHLNLAENGNLTASCVQLLKRDWRSIEVLDLSVNRVHGRLPSSIENMTSLVDFSLFANKITGGIPSSIGFLCNLKSLNIAGNNLTGGLPEFLEGTENCITRSPLPNLMYLRLSSNRLVGNLPNWLGELHNLMELSLDNNLLQGPILASLGRLSFLTDMGLGGNKLNGSLPNSIGELSELVSLDVSFNQLTGTVSEAHFSKLSNLKFLIMSSNSLILNVSSKWVPPFHVHNLDMRSCQLGPSFPDWLETQKEINYLDISNASISGLIPNWFWDLSSNLSLLNASFNQLQGQLPNPLPIAFFADIDFRSNLLTGPIPLPMIQIELLDLSNNQFSGPIPSSIGDVLSNLVFLSLSSNSITSEIPTSIGNMLLLEVLNLSQNNLTSSIPSSLQNCSYLKALDLRQNNLSGVIPLQLGQLLQIQTLHLSDNSLSGELPSSLQNCSSLETLDIGNNKFSGNIPPWIGKRLTNLRVLRLSSDAFSGRLSSQLSNLKSLQVLDLANNNLVGDIPASLGDLQAMTQAQSLNKYLLYGKFNGLYYEENVVIYIKGHAREYTKTLSLVSCIDLSGNNLVGEFPEVMTNLGGLIVLNLSRNHISGSIPEKIANMHELESLDVSNNQLSGNIPLSMTSMTPLGSLNFSNNNFSGKIPYTGQMTTFDASSYYGNPGLCGPPLLTSCQSGGGGGDSDRRGTVDEDKSDIKDTGFYLSLGLGFAAGILVPCVILAIKKSWSDAYFGFVDTLINRTLQMCSSRVTTDRNRPRR